MEELVGESMEDMGLVENVEEYECEDCGRLIEDYMKGKSTVCGRCRSKYDGSCGDA